MLGTFRMTRDAQGPLPHALRRQNREAAMSAILDIEAKDPKIQSLKKGIEDLRNQGFKGFARILESLTPRILIALGGVYEA
jgi:hypothetical protein